MQENMTQTEKEKKTPCDWKYPWVDPMPALANIDFKSALKTKENFLFV